MTNSRQKGARFEREWAGVLRHHGWEARRGCQFAGGVDSPDVQCDSLVHWECKHVEHGNAWNFMEQAHGDAGPKVPAVAWKKNRLPTLCIMFADDLLRLLRDAEAYRALSPPDDAPQSTT